ncbi:MAG: hypothetical protein WDN26_18585 [Chitinophagaceae bacterium]
MSQDLLQQYQNTPRLFQLAERISLPTTVSEPGSPSQKIYLKNLYGSSSQFVAGAAFLHPSCSQLNHIIILNDAEEAAYFHNTLENLTGALDIFYFPDSFKNRKNYRLLNSSHVMLRTEALTKIAAGGNKKILVTYPEALFEKCVLPSALSSNIIHIKSGDTLNVEQLLLRLSGYGFERTDFVYEPGQSLFAAAYWIFNSFGNDKPYRIELFGNDIDSIRIVDPETQLSERKLLQVSIIPMVDTQFDDEDKVSLFDFLPANTVVWLQDYDVCKERLMDCEDDMHAFLRLQEELREQGIKVQGARHKMQNAEDDDKLVKKDVRAVDFITAADLEEKIFLRHVIAFGYNTVFPSQDSIFTIDFSTKEQPAFNRQFDLLIKDLKTWEAKGFQLYLFAENPSNWRGCRRF